MELGADPFDDRQHEDFENICKVRLITNREAYVLDFACYSTVIAARPLFQTWQLLR